MKARLFVMILFAASPLSADPLGPLLPKGDPQPEDIEEVEDVADDRDYLPPEYGVAPINRERIKKVERDVQEVLERPDTDIRADHSLALALVRGTASPWQGLAFDVQAILSPTSTLGLMIGTGKFEENGEVAERSFDMEYESRAVGFGWKNYFERYEPFGWQLFAGYAAWEGKVIPSGSDDLSTGDDRLTSSFEANGWFLGANLALAWYWETGVFVEWVPIGIQTTRILQLKKTTDSSAVDDAVKPAIESPAFYGISNLKLGMML